MSKQDGGPAFPVESMAKHAGMSLRDWFAGQALAGLMLHAKVSLSEEPLGINTAKWAYELADAMLAQRAKGGE